MNESGLAEVGGIPVDFCTAVALCGLTTCVIAICLIAVQQVIEILLFLSSVYDLLLSKMLGPWQYLCVWWIMIMQLFVMGFVVLYLWRSCLYTPASVILIVTFFAWNSPLCLLLLRYFYWCAAFAFPLFTEKAPPKAFLVRHPHSLLSITFSLAL